MKIKKETLLNIYFVMFFFYIFFNLIFKVQSYAIWLLSTIIIIIELISRKKLFFNIWDFILLSFPAIMILSSILSPLSGSALKFSITFLALTIISLLLTKENIKNINEKFIFNTILLFSGIHVFSTIFYQLFPNLWQQILPIFLKGSDLIYNIKSFNIQHINCGLSPIQNANAMYISAFIMCCLIGMFKYNKKYIFLFLIGFVALMLCSKRGVLLAIIITSLLFYCIYVSKEKKGFVKSFFKIMFFILIFSIIGLFIIKNYFPDALRIIERFTNQNDITTGRKDIYEVLLDAYFNGNIIFGNGLFYSRYKLLIVFGTANDAHNIYIQVLTELGLPGMFCFLLIIFSTLKKIIKVEKFDNVLIMMATFYTFLFLIYGITGNGLFDLSILPFWYFLISFLFIKKEEKI